MQRIICQLFLVLKLEIETTGPQHTWRQAHFAWTQTGEFNLQQNCHYFSKANDLTQHLKCCFGHGQSILLL